MTPHRTRFFFPSTHHHRGYARHQNRPGAHEAWFNGHYERALFQSPGLKMLCRLADRVDLSVPGGVMIVFAAIVPRTDNLTFGIYHHRADRYLTGACCALSFVESQAHPAFMLSQCRNGAEGFTVTGVSTTIVVFHIAYMSLSKAIYSS